jgi:hypothetical protein
MEGARALVQRRVGSHSSDDGVRNEYRTHRANSVIVIDRDLCFVTPRNMGSGTVGGQTECDFGLRDRLFVRHDHHRRGGRHRGLFGPPQ